MKALTLFWRIYENFKLFCEEKMDDTVFVQTYIQRLSELQESDIVWAKSNLDEDNEAVQSLLMEMVLSFYATDLVDMKDYEDYLTTAPLESMSLKELQARLIHLFHEDRVHPE